MAAVVIVIVTVQQKTTHVYHACHPMGTNSPHTTREKGGGMDQTSRANPQDNTHQRADEKPDSKIHPTPETLEHRVIKARESDTQDKESQKHKVQ